MKKYKFKCDCGCEEFDEVELVKVTRHYHYPGGYTIFKYEDDWSWSSDTTSDEETISEGHIYCHDCGQDYGELTSFQEFADKYYEKGNILLTKK